MTEPEVIVRPRPEVDLKEILRVDAGGFFVLLEVGAETVWSFYDWPERQLTNVSCTRVTGTVKYRGEECLDVSDILIWGEDAGVWRTRWIYRVADETLTILLREIHQRGRAGKISEVDVTPEPLRLRIGEIWNGHEVYRCGAEEEGLGEVGHALIEGPFEIQLLAGTSLCLRKTWWSFDSSRVARSLAESYVTETGRTVYFRRFNGPGWHNYGKLAGNPEREHEGIVWRLWYECLPDIALTPPGG